MRKLVIWLPLIIGISIGAGILLGARLGSSKTNSDKNRSYEKIKAVLTYVQANYVDSVNADQLTDITLQELLQHLDPHSDYFTAAQVKLMDEPLAGNFEGIGILYLFKEDTLVVDQVVPGGPSEKAGLKSGDRILKANDTTLTGKFATQEFIGGKLRGIGGTKVTITIKRPTEKSQRNIVVTRGSIPIYSVESAYMVNDSVGYVKLVRFATTSYNEFMAATNKLLAQGMKSLILDLRDNGGGFLDAATDIADEFLPDGKMIVDTKGRADGETKTVATNKGKLENVGLAILVDENTASASEVLSGAIQDNDRGIIIGRRTFGKGLVLEEKKLTDGSAFRLTIARYYCPTGRCVQKPYNKGLEAYEADEQNRYDHGELLNADSIKYPDSLKFKTPKGKIVYGASGITPDIFIPLDTSGGSKYLDNLFRKDIFTLWAMNYVDKNKIALTTSGLENFRKTFVITDAMENDLFAVGEKNGVARNDVQAKRSEKQIRIYMKTYIAREMWGVKSYNEIWNDTDAGVTAAVKAL